MHLRAIICVQTSIFYPILFVCRFSDLNHIGLCSNLLLLKMVSEELVSGSIYLIFGYLRITMFHFDYFLTQVKSGLNTNAKETII